MKRRKDRSGQVDPKQRSTFLEWNLRAELYAFGKRLNEEFNEDLLQEAFTDRSYVIQQEMRQQELEIEEPLLNLNDNRNLAGKGEEILNEYITAFLNVHLPNFPSDGIKAVKDNLLSDAKLAYVSKYLGTTEIILSAVIEFYTLSR